MLYTKKNQEFALDVNIVLIQICFIISVILKIFKQLRLFETIHINALTFCYQSLESSYYYDFSQMYASLLLWHVVHGKEFECACGCWWCILHTNLAKLQRSLNSIDCYVYVSFVLITILLNVY